MDPNGASTAAMAVPTTPPETGLATPPDAMSSPAPSATSSAAMQTMQQQQQKQARLEVTGSMAGAGVYYFEQMLMGIQSMVGESALALIINKVAPFHYRNLVEHQLKLHGIAVPPQYPHDSIIIEHTPEGGGVVVTDLAQWVMEHFFVDILSVPMAPLDEYAHLGQSTWNQYLNDSNRTIIHMAFAVGNETIGDIDMELTNPHPGLIDTIKALAQQPVGAGGYAGTKIEYLVKGGWIQVSDLNVPVPLGDYEPNAPKHLTRGQVSIVNPKHIFDEFLPHLMLTGPHIVPAAQLFLTLGHLPDFDFHYAVIGHLVDGYATLDALEQLPVDPATNCVTMPCTVVACEVRGNSGHGGMPPLVTDTGLTSEAASLPLSPTSANADDDLLAMELPPMPDLMCVDSPIIKPAEIAPTESDATALAKAALTTAFPQSPAPPVEPAAAAHEPASEPLNQMQVTGSPAKGDPFGGSALGFVAPPGDATAASVPNSGNSMLVQSSDGPKAATSAIAPQTSAPPPAVTKQILESPLAGSGIAPPSASSSPATMASSLRLPATRGLRSPSQTRFGAPGSAPAAAPDVAVGDRVAILTGPPPPATGTVQYLGETQFKAGIWAGVELDAKGTGKNDGAVAGVQYFACAPKSGIFVPAEKVVKISSAADAAAPAAPVAAPAQPESVAAAASAPGTPGGASTPSSTAGSTGGSGTLARKPSMRLKPPSSAPATPITKGLVPPKTPTTPTAPRGRGRSASASSGSALPSPRTAHSAPTTPKPATGLAPPRAAGAAGRNSPTKDRGRRQTVPALPMPPGGAKGIPPPNVPVTPTRATYGTGTTRLAAPTSTSRSARSAASPGSSTASLTPRTPSNRRGSSSTTSSIRPPSTTAGAGAGASSRPTTPRQTTAALTQELQQARAKVDEQGHELERVHVQVQQEQALIADLQMELGQVRARVANLESENQFLSTELQLMVQQKMTPEEIQRMVEDLDRLTYDLHRAQGQAATLEETIAARDAKIAGLERDKVELNAKLKKMAAQVESLEDQVGELQDTIEDLHEASSGKHQEEEYLRLLNDRKKMEINYETKISTLEYTVQQLNAQLTQSKDEVDRERKNVAAERAAAQAELEKDRAALQAEREASTDGAKIAELEARVKQRDADVAEMESRLAAAGAELVRQAAAMETAQNDLAVLRKEKADLSVSLTALQDQLASHAASVGAIETELARAENEARRREDRVRAECRQVEDELRSRLAKATMDVSSLSQERDLHLLEIAKLKDQAAREHVAHESEVRALKEQLTLQQTLVAQVPLPMAGGMSRSTSAANYTLASMAASSGQNSPPMVRDPLSANGASAVPRGPTSTQVCALCEQPGHELLNCPKVSISSKLAAM
ncbi:hypothetical protein AMAG_19939 [Allomyces macrogynus ATCC 38327]|uniref:CAP-Gly domain-containing protein n=1 Tax=Allomyces macrogynus (strain ATCC 38327) TaxID=578462 RepID=A0A0L0T2L1_ALLM3|nr:hypothetical protein AMAG_19939 [Allomyces macrogynus ATCC 38327]|eukprot:KNE68956.1 hypothetical protein AMAG_19939 [Allomyces macrogynus ATCC 38327]